MGRGGILGILAILLILTACGGGPRFETDDVTLSVTPEQAAEEPERLEGIRILWGGVIVRAVNQEERTRLEVLAYPLDSEQRPDTETKAGIRFLAEKAGYLETADYAPGRRVTVKGTLQGIREGRIGEAPHTYPVVQVSDLHLWPKAEARRSGPRFHFGIGVIFGN